MEQISLVATCYKRDVIYTNGTAHVWLTKT